jgi:hypothetical protein
MLRDIAEGYGDTQLMGILDAAISRILELEREKH